MARLDKLSGDCNILSHLSRPDAFGCYLFALSYLLFPICSFLFAVTYLLFPICCYLFAVTYLLFPICSFLFAVTYLLFPIS